MVYVFAPAVEDVQGEVKFRAFRLDFKRFVDAVSVGGKGVGDPDVAQARTDFHVGLVLDLPAGVGDLDRIGTGVFWGEVGHGVSGIPQVGSGVCLDVQHVGPLVAQEGVPQGGGGRV